MLASLCHFKVIIIMPKKDRYLSGNKSQLSTIHLSTASKSIIPWCSERRASPWSQSGDHESRRSIFPGNCPKSLEGSCTASNPLPNPEPHHTPVPCCNQGFGGQTHPGDGCWPPRCRHGIPSEVPRRQMGEDRLAWQPWSNSLVSILRISYAEEFLTRVATWSFKSEITVDCLDWTASKWSTRASRASASLTGEVFSYPDVALVHALVGSMVALL